MAKKIKGQSSAKTVNSPKHIPKGRRYVCTDCGTEAVMNGCGVDFKRRVCCGLE